MRTVIKGKTWKLGDDINTDLILPGPYLTMRDTEQMMQHVLEGAIPRFAEKIRKGEIIVAGKNFGSGSSREIAPLLLKRLGVGAVVAESFARIFFRNAINIGLPVIECKDISEKIKSGDVLEINLETGTIKNVSRKENYAGTRLPKFLLEIIEAGGALKRLRQSAQ
ncbi:MAG: 3-isopropylmalate dehydratase small subunit [Candidatus Bathyarchaeia archaeon]|nr:3-isopropylmalate dehydratase small subunit [Candidatus Bathyarchaeota archaeon A05DMB-4]MDH7594788.1 3-isopropylmalate dehydratase small subunit [Candidatus Bathyarchaeota archaeon]